MHIMKKAAVLLSVALLIMAGGCSTKPAETGTAPSPLVTSALAASPVLTTSELMHAPTPAQPWLKKTAMPTARYELKAAALCGKLYVLGGSDGSGQLSVVEVYDPASGIWSRVADIPVAASCLGAADVNGKLYAFMKGSSFDIKAAVYEYDPAADTWLKVSDMTSSRCNLGVAVLGGKIYVVGGLVNTDDQGGFTNVGDVEVFDPDTKKWTKKAGLPVAKHAVAVAAAGGKLYAIGGSVTRNDGDYPSKTVEEYDPVTDTWTAKANLGMDSAYHCAAEIGGRIFVTGGLLRQYLYVYSPAADKWDIGCPRVAASWQNAVAALDGKLYVVGGTLDFTDNWKPIDSLEEYDPVLDTMHK